MQFNNSYDHANDTLFLLLSRHAKLLIFWKRELRDETKTGSYFRKLYDQRVFPCWANTIDVYWLIKIWPNVFFALPESISSARVLQQPGPQALRFSHRGKRETRSTREWLVTKRKGPWERENTAFPCAQIFLERDTGSGYGYEAGAATFSCALIDFN